MGPTPAEKPPKQQVGRYAIFDEIAAGGMATVHIARFEGPLGFARVVAAKRLHPHLLNDDDFKRMFLDEARLAARIRHPNVVQTVDVLVHAGEIILVMDYVHGESLFELHKAARENRDSIPLPIAAAVLVSVLHGLHAAHEARNEKGQPLQIVHRDVSPHNVLVGVDGAVRVLDFGVAKAIQARADTRPGTLKGKFSYMAPEVLRGEGASQQSDIFSAAVVFWELVTNRKLFGGMNEHDRMQKILSGQYPAPTSLVRHLPRVLDRIVMKALHPEVTSRYKTALEMAVEVEHHLAPASQRVVGEWVKSLAAESLAHKAELLQAIEISHIHSVPPPAVDERVARVHRSVAENESWSAYPWAHPAPKTRPWIVGGIAGAALATMVGATLLRSQWSSPSPVSVVAAQSPAEPVSVAPAAPPPLAAPPPSASADSPSSVHADEPRSEPAGPAKPSSRTTSLPRTNETAKKPQTRVRPTRPPAPPPLPGPWPQGNAKPFLPDDL